jgi:hypothetical protein
VRGNKQKWWWGFFKIYRKIALGSPYWRQEYLIAQGRRSQGLQKLKSREGTKREK